MTLLLIVAGLTVLISSMCSLFEATLYSARLGALEAEKAEGKYARRADRFIAMKTNIAQPTSAILVLNTIANTAGATLCGMYAAQLLGAGWVPAFSAGLTLAILFVGEILPKTYGATHWRSIWRLIVWPLALMQRGLSPIIRVTQAFANFFTGSLGAPAVTEDEIRAYIHLGRKEGELSASEQRLLNAVFHFDDMLARQVMVARQEVVFFDVHWSLEQCLAVAKETRHTRFPLCVGSLDEVLGLVHVKDLLGMTDGRDDVLRSVARPLRHIPRPCRSAGCCGRCNTPTSIWPWSMTSTGRSLASLPWRMSLSRLSARCRTSLTASRRISCRTSPASSPCAVSCRLSG